ncbi:MAG: hypothetical protein IPH13_21780 [Planctomycetes bacterium]|nr:hypothetical protein [Planctomycetota bacterium]
MTIVDAFLADFTGEVVVADGYPGCNRVKTRRETRRLLIIRTTLLARSHDAPA